MFSTNEERRCSHSCSCNTTIVKRAYHTTPHFIWLFIHIITVHQIKGPHYTATKTIQGNGQKVKGKQQSIVLRTQGLRDLLYLALRVSHN